MNIGIYVDLSNISLNGGFGMDFEILRKFACRHENSQAQRLNVYIAFDEKRANEDPNYKLKQQNYHSLLRSLGFKVIIKKAKHFLEKNGVEHIKANTDLDMAVDVLLQSEKLDYILLVTGDGDFVQVVKALQNKGCRVEVLAFKNVSREIQNEADLFISGYLIHGLLPAENSDIRRGICYFYDRSKKYGFIRYIEELTGDIWIKDSRQDNSCYKTVFFQEKDLDINIDPNTLPNRERIFEFELSLNPQKKIKENEKLTANNIKIIY